MEIWETEKFWEYKKNNVQTKGFSKWTIKLWFISAHRNCPKQLHKKKKRIINFQNPYFETET